MYVKIEKKRFWKIYPRKYKNYNNGIS